MTIALIPVPHRPGLDPCGFMRLDASGLRAELTGSPKQVAWAETLRAKFEDQVIEVVGRALKTRHRLSGVSVDGGWVLIALRDTTEAEAEAALRETFVRRLTHRHPTRSS